MSAGKALQLRVESSAGPTCSGPYAGAVFSSPCRRSREAACLPLQGDMSFQLEPGAQTVMLLPTYVRQCSGAKSQLSLRDAVAQTSSIWHR